MPTKPLLLYLSFDDHAAVLYAAKIELIPIEIMYST